MNSKTIALSAFLLAATAGSAVAAPGPKEACQALSEQTRAAVTLKKEGVVVDKAVAQLSAQPVPSSVPSAQQDFYKPMLSGAIRFAYMGRMSADGMAAFYLKQCLQGS